MNWRLNYKRKKLQQLCLGSLSVYYYYCLFTGTWTCMCIYGQASIGHAMPWLRSQHSVNGSAVTDFHSSHTHIPDQVQWERKCKPHNLPSWERILIIFLGLLSWRRLFSLRYNGRQASQDLQKVYKLPSNSAFSHSAY